MNKALLIAIVDGILAERLPERGPRGQRGKPGKDFNLDDHIEEVSEILNDLVQAGKDSWKVRYTELTAEEKEDLKLKFEDLTLEDLERLQGPKGKKGKDGKDGDNFIFTDHEDKIYKSINEYVDTLDLKLQFEDLTEHEKLSLKGKKGEKGDIGHSGEQGEKGDRGPRGQRGKSGPQGEVGDKGERGSRGVQGLPGVPGVRGRAGLDGKDAPFIIDIEISQVSDKKFSLIFYFSDGSKLETPDVKLPSIQQLAYSMMASTGGGGSSLTISDGITTVDPVSDLVVSGATLTDDGNGQVTMTIDDQPGDCLTVADEGNNVTTCAKTINFVGETVQAYNSTVMADWPDLATIDSIASWEAAPGGLVTVEIKPQATSLQKTYTTGEDISALQVVRLDASELVFKATSDTIYSDSKAIGISLTSATTGNDASVLMFGILEDNIFSYTPNEPLFVGLNGVITDIPPSQPTNSFSTQIGHGLGAGSIFVSIREPIGL